MRDRLPLAVLLGCALTFLVSLYLPWQETHSSGTGPGVLGLLNLFANDGNVQGWAAGAGVVASLAALALVGLAAHALVRPGAVARIPLRPVALALLYLAIADVLVLRAEEKIYGPRLHFHYAYGAYLGLAAAAVALAAAGLIEKSVVRRPSAAEAVAALLGAGLLVSFLLPWASPFGPEGNLEFPGMTLGLVVLLAAGLCLLSGAAVRRAVPLPMAALAIPVLTGASVNAIWPDRIRYGAWMGLGFAVALVALAARARPLPRLVRPTFAVGLAAAAATVLVVSLFLPWQQFCDPGGQAYGHGIGSCIATTGWANTDAELGSVTGVLALVLIFGAVAASRVALPLTEAILAIAALVAAMGASIGKGIGYPNQSFGYGAYLGFAATGIVLFIALARVPPPRIESRHAIVRLVPLAAAFAAFLTIALPVWSALPERWDREEVVLNGWYVVAAVLLTIHLLRRWLDSARRSPFPPEQLLVLPLALLALSALELIRHRSEGMTWGGGILVGLCLFLALLGWKEMNGSLDSVRIPEEIWRVDRLPGES